MKLHELAPAPGSKQTRNRVGRGLGSGNGKTAGISHSSFFQLNDTSILTASLLLIDSHTIVGSTICW